MSFSCQVCTRLRPDSLAACAGAVRGGQQLRDTGGLGRDRHHADAGAEAEAAVLPDEAEFLHRFQQGLGGLDGLLQGAVLQQDAELVAAQARQGVAPADLRLQQRTELAEQRVARHVAAGVVDDLELVEIHVAQRVLRFARTPHLQRPLQAGLELAPVHQARQHVVAGVVGQAAVQLARLADVVEYQHAADDLAHVVADRRRGTLDVELVAVAPDQQHGAHRLVQPVTADGDRQRVLHRLAGLLVEAAEDLVHLAPGGIVQRPASELLRHRVEVLDTTVRVRGDHAVADGLQRDLRVLLLAEQRFLVELLVGDIELDPDQAQHPALIVHEGLGAAHHPAPFAGTMAHAMHALEQLRLALEVVADLALHPHHVLRMHQLAPVRHVLVGLVLAEAHHDFPAGRETDGVALDVEIPQAVVGGVAREFFTLVDVFQFAAELEPRQCGREAGAKQFQQQVDIDVPALHRPCGQHAQHAAQAALDVQAGEQRRARRHLAHHFGLALETGGETPGIADLDQAHVAQLAAKPLQVGESRAGEAFRAAARHDRGSVADLVKGGAVRGQQREAHGVRAQRLADHFE